MNEELKAIYSQAVGTLREMSGITAITDDTVMVLEALQAMKQEIETEKQMPRLYCPACWKNGFSKGCPVCQDTGFIDDPHYE